MLILPLLIINLFALTAQAPKLPMTITIAWDASPSARDYAVKQDDKLVGTTDKLTLPVTITSLGTHTITVTAQAPGQVSPPATLILKVTKDALPPILLKGQVQ